MVLILNLQTLNEICDYILFSLHCLYSGKNVDTKLTNLILGKMSWREACAKKNYVNSDELNKFEKAMNYLETLNCFSCFNLEFTKNLKEDQNIVFENIILFFLFYEALLKTCLKINIDMSMPRLNEFYSGLDMKNILKSCDDKNLVNLLLKSKSEFNALNIFDDQNNDIIINTLDISININNNIL